MAHTIKPCTEGDAEYIWEMDKAESVCAGSCSDGSEDLLVFKVEAEDGGIIGGCVLSVDLSGTAEFNSLFVDERFRRRGIGTANALEAEREARARGCRMMINAYNFDFQFARPLFEKLGYVLIGTAKDWPRGHESYTLVKKLGDSRDGSLYAPSPASISCGDVEFKIMRGNAEDGEYVTARLAEFNSGFAPRTHPYIDLDKKILDENGNIICGCIAGVSGWNAAHIDLIWVEARFRGQGLEAALISEIEREAKALGAFIARTGADEAQAARFIEQGYDVIAVYDGEPRWFVMQKTLR